MLACSKLYVEASGYANNIPSNLQANTEQARQVIY